MNLMRPCRMLKKHKKEAEEMLLSAETIEKLQFFDKYARRRKAALGLKVLKRRINEPFQNFRCQKSR